MSGKFPAKPGAGYLARKGFRRSLLIQQGVQGAGVVPARIAEKPATASSAKAKEKSGEESK